jgi:hypothetical protein
MASVQRAFDQLGPYDLKKVLQKASSAGAKTVKPYVKAETPRRTGTMRKSVSATQARRDRPAAIVKFRIPRAWYRHFVVKGTTAHQIRFPDQKAKGIPAADGNIRHPGNRSNDIMGRAWSKAERATLDAIDKVINDYIDSI